VQKQQILIIESELTPSFIKGPESTNILVARHTSKDKHTSALMLLSCSCKSFLTVQLNCWRSGKVQQLARAKDLFYCLFVHLYAHLPSSALLLAIAHPISKKISVIFRFLSITWSLNSDPLCSFPCQSQKSVLQDFPPKISIVACLASRSSFSLHRSKFMSPKP
jgi:hypothetical protein